MPGASKEITSTFTNTTRSAVKTLQIGLSLPNQQWSGVIQGTSRTSKTFSDAVEPGAVVSATFTVTPGPKAFNGDLLGHATWTNAAGGTQQTETIALKVRSAAPVKINEFRIGSGTSGNPTDSFIELYNAGADDVDLSDWTLTERPAQQATFSAIRVPSGTKLGAKRFYLLGLSNSGLVVPAQPGDTGAGS